MVKKNRIIQNEQQKSDEEIQLKKRQDLLKEKRCMDCWEEIQRVLKKHKCELEPQLILTGKGTQASFNIQAL